MFVFSIDTFRSQATTIHGDLVVLLLLLSVIDHRGTRKSLEPDISTRYYRHGCAFAAAFDSGKSHTTERLNLYEIVSFRLIYSITRRREDVWRISHADHRTSILRLIVEYIKSHNRNRQVSHIESTSIQTLTLNLIKAGDFSFARVKTQTKHL